MFREITAVCRKKHTESITILFGEKLSLFLLQAEQLLHVPVGTTFRILHSAYRMHFVFHMILQHPVIISPVPFS